MKSVISTAYAPFAIIERIRRDACSIGFVFVDASGNDLDISGQDYQVLFVRDGGFTALTKTAVHALTNRLEITLTDAEKDQLRDAKYGLVLYNVTASRTELNAVFTWQQGRQSSAGVLSPPDLKIKLNIVTGDAEVAGLIITGIQGSRGWSPVLANVPTGIRVVQQLVDWVGGQGVKPAITGDGGAPLYVKNTGFTTIIADATDVRGIQGYAGWTAILGNIISGARVVQQLLDWVGGTGTKPAITGDGGAALYVSATGFTITIADATDVRGLQGYAGWTAIFANVPDGARIVQRLADMVGGTGTKPAITGDGGAALYLGSAGLTTTLANATDIRGPIGFNWQGSYTAGTNYVAADAFVFRGSAYRVNNPFTGALPFSRTNVTRILRGINPTGAHQTNTQYYIDDLVTDSGNTYIRLTDGLSGASFPGVGADWALWAQKGDPGTLTASAFAVASIYDTANHLVVVQKGTTLEKMTRNALLDFSSVGLPAIRPTLMMDFANSRYVSPRVTHTRSGTGAARYNAVRKFESIGANIPRIDYNRVTGKCLGLLGEVFTANYSAYAVVPSQWGSAGATKTDNVVLAPDGSLAPTWTNTPNVGSSFFTGITTGFVMAANTDYTYSFHVYLVSATSNSSKLVVTEINLGSTSGRANFDLYSLTASKTANISAASMEDAGGGWYRCIVTFRTDATGTPGVVRNYIGAYGSTPETVTVSGWGAQLEPKDYVTSLVPNTGLTAGNRNSEASKIITDPSWFNAKEGTIIIDALFPATTTNPNFGIISLTGVGNILDRIDLRSNNFLVSVGGVGQTVPGSAGTTAGVLNRYGMTYKAGKTSVCRNGGAVNSAATASIPVVTNFLLGGVDGGAANGRVWTPRFEYYPVQFSDSQLTAATVL